MRSEFFGQWMVSIKLAHRKPRSPLHKSSRSAREVVWNVSVSSRTERGEDTEDISDYPWGNLSHGELPRQNYKKEKECFWAHVNSVYRFSLRKQSFLLSPRRQGHLARRNVCDSLTEFHTDDVKSVRNPVKRADWSKTVIICGIYSSLEEAFEFCWSSFAEEHNTSPKSRNVKLNKFAFGTPWLFIM